MSPIMCKAYLVIFLAIVTIFSCAAAPGSKSDHFQFDSLFHGGIKRTYMVHLPAAYTGDKSLPLFIALHGGGGDGEKAEKISRISHQSNKEEFILVYPDAVGRNWNDGRAVKKYLSHRKNIDDVGFISALIDKLRNEYAIDTRRV